MSGQPYAVRLFPLAAKVLAELPEHAEETRESRQKPDISVEKAQLSLHTLRAAERHITLYSAPP